MTRDAARTAIVNAAQKHRRERTSRDSPRGSDGYVILPPVLEMRHLQRCVCICRRNRLVKPDVLRAAGFRVKERRR